MGYTDKNYLCVCQLRLVIPEYIKKMFFNDSALKLIVIFDNKKLQSLTIKIV